MTFDDDLRTKVIGRIAAHEAASPRSLQTAIGPSEIGHPCDRRLAYHALAVPPVNDGGVPWYPIIGTAVHAWLAAAFDGFEGAVAEQRVHVNDWLSGACDLWLPDHGGTVLDWKVVGNAALTRYTENGPGDQYRVQSHLYGVGWARAGRPVANVAIVFLPRANNLDRTLVWSEPFNPALAADAVARYDRIAEIAVTAGPAILPLIPTADANCSWCPHHVAAVTEVAEACPGHDASHKPRAALADPVPA
jgi:hypothetical protein